MSTNSSDRAWARWTPTAEQRWDVRRVVHLHRRVGFAANWSTIQRDLKDGPDAAIGRLLKPQINGNQNSASTSSASSGTAPASDSSNDFEQMAKLIGDAAVGSESPMRLKAWWLYRMLFTPDPLGERLTLMWHNHFATSNQKIKSLDLMRRQNNLFREFARAPFGEMIQRVAKDPATLVWLDADANRKEHPNENLAREIMELFTLGVGNYTETDVKEAARMLTGWTVKDGRYREVAQYHDDGSKTLFGKSGIWNGDDLVKMLVDHPAIANRLAFRLCELLMGERLVSDAEVNELATVLRENQLDIGLGVEAIIRSKLFFSDRNIGNRVLSPVEYVINVIRSLELLSPPPSTLLLAEWTTTLGQDLFYPPNVFGWPGGRSWLTTRSLIGRSNFAASMADGSIFKPHQPFDAEKLAARYDFDRSRAAEFLGQLFAGADASSPFVKQQADRLQSSGESTTDMFIAFLNSPMTLLG